MAGGLFSGLKDAQMFDKGTPLRAQPNGTNGHYVLEVKKTLVKKTQQKGWAFIAEFVIVESDVAANPVGTTASWYQNLTNEQVAMGALKEFLGTVHGYDLRDPAHKAHFKQYFEPTIEQRAEEAGDETKNPLKGKRIKCETQMVKTKEQKDFTRHVWTPVAAPAA